MQRRRKERNNTNERKLESEFQQRRKQTQKQNTFISEQTFLSFPGTSETDKKVVSLS